jgi:hypothetical protein
MLEQIFLRPRDEVVTEAVRPLKHSSTGDYLVRRILQELKLADRVALHIMKLLNLPLDPRKLALAQLLRITVIHKPLVVEHVAIQLSLRGLSLGLLS